MQSKESIRTDPQFHQLGYIRVLQFILCLIICVMEAESVQAQSPKVVASIDTQELFIGESITYQVEVQNIENPTPPDLSAFDELFDVEAAGDQSQNQSSTFIINGRVTQRNTYSHVYFYKLTPKKSGRLVIPPVTVKVNGDSFPSNSITLSIQDLEKQDVVLLQTTVDPPTVYPTQKFSVSLRILVKGLPKSTAEPLQPLRRRQLPHLQIDWLKSMDGLKANDAQEWLSSKLSGNGVGFTLNEYNARSGGIFESARPAVFNFYVGRENRLDSSGSDVQYYIYEINREFTAEKTGSYQFGSSMVKGTFVTGVEGTEYVGKRIVAVAEPFSVVVKEVPDPRPTGFSGAIGSFRIQTNASPNSLRVGDPLTLSIEFERGTKSGSLDLISAPKLSNFQELVRDFEIVDANPTGRIEGNTKKFGYAIRPKKPGVSIPKLAFSTFDPVAEKFEEVCTEPIPLKVVETTQISSADIIGGMANNKTNANEIRSSNQGIFQNITNVAEVRNESVPIAQRGVLIAASWLVCALASFGVHARRRRAADTVGQRRQRANRNAHSKLQSAILQTQEPKQAIKSIRDAIVGLAADYANRPAEGMTSIEVIDVFARSKVPTEVLDQVRKIMEEIESSEYGGGFALNLSEIVRTTKSIVDRVTPLLERSYR